MAIDAGSVFVRLGAQFTGREEFDRYDRAIDRAQQKARGKKLKAELGGQFDPHAFNQYERRLGEARQRAERQKKFKAILGADFDRRAFNSYEKALRESNVHTERATRATKEHEKSLGRLRHTIGLGLGAVGLGGLAFGLRDVAKAGLEMETSQAKVQRAVHNAGISWHRYGDQIDHALTRQSLLTGFQKQDVENAFANMIRTTGNVSEALKLNGLAMDIARTKGMNLLGAQSLLARVYNGNLRGLKSLGINIIPVTKAQDALHASSKKITPQMLAQAKAQDAVATRTEALRVTTQKFSGQSAAYAKTTQGSFDRARAAFEIMQQKLGAVLLPKLATAGTALANFFIQMDEGKGAGGRFAATMTSIANTLRPIVTWLGRAIGNIFKFAAAHTTITKIALGFVGTAVAIHKVSNAVEAIKTAKAVGHVRTLLGWLGRLGSTTAGKKAEDEIVSSMAGVPHRSGRVLDRVKGLWRRILGNAGASAGTKAGEDIVSSMASNVSAPKSKERFKGSMKGLGKVGGAALIGGIIIGLVALFPMVWKDLKRMFEQSLFPQLGREIGDKIKHLPGDILKHITPGHDLLHPGGAEGGLWTPSGFIRGLAAGGVHSGTALVGEQGPELVDLPFGSRVHSNTASRRLVRDMASDLMGLPKAATAAGAKTAKALEDRLTQGYKNSRKQTKAINKDVGSDFEDLRKDSDKTFKRLADKTGDHFDSIRKDSARSSTRTRDTVTDRFSDMRRDSGKHLDRLRNAVKDRFADVAATGKRQSQRLRSSVGSSMGSLDQAVQAGMDYVGRAVNEALRSFGAKPVNLSVPKPRGLREGGLIPAMVSPGEMIVDPSGASARVPGARVAADSVFTFLRRGTAVLTGHGQNLVRQGASLQQALRDQLPHFRDGGSASHWDRLVGAANKVDRAGFPYVLGGGHENPANFEPFDCSGAVSYVVQQAGYRVPTTVSGGMGSLGFPGGSGRATIFYNGGHTFMRIGDRYFGTSGFGHPAKGGGAAWFTKSPGAGYLAGFSTVHLPDLGKESVGVGGQVNIPRIGVRGPAGGLRSIASSAINKMRNAGSRYSERKFSEMDAGAGQALADAGGASGPNVALGKRLAERFAGWGHGAEWSALKVLWQQESGWDANAVNPRSGAYGIPQALGHGHPFNLGDASAQIKWGLRYIRDRYGDPIAAEGHEQSVGWYRAGGHVPKKFHSANSDSKAIQTLQGRLDADDHWYQYFQQKSDIEGWNPAAKLIGLDQDEIGIMRRQERLAHRALRSLGLEHGHVSRTEGRYRKELRSDAGHISRLKRRLEDLGLPRGSSAQTRRFEQLKRDIRRQLAAPHLSRAEKAHLHDELRTVGEEETAAKGGDRRRLAELKLRIRREIRKLQDRDKRIKKKLADLKKKATGGSVDADALRQMLIDLPWSIRDKQLDIEQLKKGGTGTTGGAAGGAADTSGDLQAKLDQALARADMLTETVRESAAAFNVFGGPGDIGAGAATALGAVADPFAYGGAGPGIGKYMDPTTGQVTFGQPLSGVLQQGPPLVGSGPHQAPPHGPGWYVLKIDDPEGQKVVGSAAVGGFSGQGYRSSSRERVGP